MMLPQLNLKVTDYPESDGEPMAETGFHVTLIAYVLAMLRSFFSYRNDVYIGANMFVYYSEGDPTKKVAPDLFVAFGVPNHERRIWKTWEEGKAPDVIFEFTSKGTWDQDLGSKKGLYAWLGVTEYFLFDPLDEYLQPRLRGFQLQEGDYAPIPANETGELVSRLLGLILRPAGDKLELIAQTSGERLLPPLELAETLRQETAARQAAEAEVARLRVELEQLKKEQ
ncbi:MAG: Uma2 family endonuclease [Anaerolineae bacterium]|nr:Uma2 family endonuclease [Anaerolineales bacterium]MCQ3979845.1 Uma2 family endonuclease [Anaerolineae bacterium]